MAYLCLENIGDQGTGGNRTVNRDESLLESLLNNVTSLTQTTGKEPKISEIGQQLFHR